MTQPLMVDLAGRSVVMIGGGPVTARRASAFRDEGALLTVIAPWVCEDIADLLADPTGGVVWHERDYLGPEDLADAWLIHTATGDADVDRRVSRDAAAQRLWCVNATDSGSTTAAVPARTTVDLPDGKVTVAVHSGHDPARSATIRTAIDRQLRAGLLDLRSQRPRSRGWVALVGGGPGVDHLLTARAHELLAAADVVVTDRLAPHGVLAGLPESVRVVDVGKSPGRHPVPQDDINALLVSEAARGHGVVRLKGGDPYVLGRGGEERLACEAHGIPVEVVPGVSSAISVPAAAGIPVTHRGLARGFTVVTGHQQLPSLPTSSSHTLVILMGVSHLDEIATTLVAQGRSPSCPVAVIERGHLPDQRTTVAALDAIARTCAARAVTSPAVIVVGDVVDLALDTR